MFPLFLNRALSAVVRHVNGYVDLIEAEAAAAARSVMTRIAMAIAGLLASLLFVAFGALWIVAAAWDQPYRLWVIGGVCLAFALAAAAAFVAAFREREGVFDRVRAEWAADRAAFSARRTGESHG